MKKSKEKAELAAKRAKARMEAAAQKTKENKERLEKLRLANIKKLADMAEKQRLANKAADEAHKRAHEQAIAARAAQEAKQLADHQAKMNERRAKFADEYPHVYIDKVTGITQVQVTLPDLNAVDNLVPILWHYNIVADIEIIQDGVIKAFVRDDVLMVEDGDFKLLMTTADERVDMLKSVVYETVFKHDPLFDFVTFSPSTGNKNYIEWVKHQTLTLDGNKADDGDDDDHPDSMDGIPEVDAGELLNATSNGTLGTTTTNTEEEPAGFISVKSAENKTAVSSVNVSSNSSLKVVDAPKVNVSEKVQVKSQQAVTANVTANIT